MTAVVGIASMGWVLVGAVAAHAAEAGEHPRVPVSAPSAVVAPAAAAPGPGTVEYAGTITTIPHPQGPQPPAGIPLERENSLVLTCEGGACSIDGIGEMHTFADPITLAFVAGRASADVQMGAGGDLTFTCGVAVTQPLVAVAEGTSLTVTISSTDLRMFGDCKYYGSGVAFEGSVVSGDPCVVTGAQPCAAASGPGAASGGRPGSAGGVSRLADGGWDAPSSLSALATVAEAPIDAGRIGAALLVTLILLILVAFPTALLNSASEQVAERWGTWRASRRAPVSAPVQDDPAPSARADWRGWPVAALCVVAAAVVSAFADPEFGVNPGSLRVVASIAIGFAVDVVLGWTVVILLTRRGRGARAAFEAKPLTLLVVVGAVVLTRLTGFEPGILFGLVAGVAFAGLERTADRARPVLVALGYAFAAALIAWFAYSAAVSAGASGSVFATETLAAIATSGIAALPIALVPLRGLPGHAVWEWSRWVWAGCYAVGLFAFFFVLMPMPSSWGEVSWPILGWVAAYLLYTAAAVGLWLIAARPWRKGDATTRSAPAEAAATASAPESAGSPPSPPA